MSDSGTWQDYRQLTQRGRELEAALQELDREEAALREELDEVEEQLAYYDSLARDMKRALDPPRLEGLLRTWKRR